MNKRKALYGLAAVPPLVPLSVYAYKALQRKRCAAPRNYDVFLNFRGSNTRTGFVDFLYSSLVAAGFHVFRDNDALPIGEEIELELLQAIRSCRIAIPIISEQYFESKWCLRELTEIMNCSVKHDTSVFPIFYKVDVVDVRRLRNNFGEALLKPEIQGRREEVAEWEKALHDVTYIGGWISQNIANGSDWMMRNRRVRERKAIRLTLIYTHVVDRNEGELVKIVVARVLNELKPTWIERLPLFPLLMSNRHIRSLYHHYLKEKGRLRQCQVFLAFRGCDTRYGFAAYLYISLVAAKIRVFYDDDSCIVGKVISDELINAIEHCKISIPILSPNFTSSPWCLCELESMVICKKTKGQKILPIFYKVNPSDVRNLSLSFESNFFIHEERFGRDCSERWKHAFKVVGSFKGWESEKIANGHEAVLVKLVVEEVLRLLKNPQTQNGHLHPLNIDSFLASKL